MTHHRGLRAPRPRRASTAVAATAVVLSALAVVGCRAAPRLPAAATPPTEATVSLGARDDTSTFEAVDGRFTLRHAPLWRQLEPPAADGAVTWLLRLERGQPGRPVPPGARRPPNGVRLDVGLTDIPPDADLATWSGAALPLDDRSFSVTTDAFPLRVGPDGLAAVAREGQILPYFGRWREWLVPVPDAADQAFVLRATSYGADEQVGMFHAKVVVATFRPNVVAPAAPRP